MISRSDLAGKRLEVADELRFRLAQPNVTPWIRGLHVTVGVLVGIVVVAICDRLSSFSNAVGRGVIQWLPRRHLFNHNET